MVNKKKADKGSELIINLHPGRQLSECLTEKTANKLGCISESVFDVFLCASEVNLTKEEILNFIKCAITSSFMLGKISAISEE